MTRRRKRGSAVCLATAVVAAGTLAASAPAAAAAPGHTELVTVGGQAIEGFTVQHPSISADGRHIAFATRFNLAPNDNADWDVYVRSPHGLVLISDSTEDSQNPSISADGRYVAFDVSGGEGHDRVQVCDRDADGDGVFDEPEDHRCIELGRSNEDNREPSLSADATTVAWNQVSGTYYNPPKTWAARLTKDEAGRLTAPESYLDLRPRDPGGAEVYGATDPPQVSADGQHVALTARLCPSGCVDSFRRQADQQRAVYAADLTPPHLTRLTVDGTPSQPAISGDGRTVALATTDHDSEYQQVVVIQRDPDGDGDMSAEEPVTSTVIATGWDPALSTDGRYLAYTALASTTAQVYARDLKRPATSELVSVPTGCTTCDGNGGSYSPALSADGGMVAFVSGASDLVTGDDNGVPDVFARTFEPTITVTPADFGSVTPGASVTRALTVRQTGFGPLRLSTPAIQGSTDFTIYPTESCGGSVLHATDECVVSIRFQPTKTGRRGALLVLNEFTTPLTGLAGPAAVYDLRITPEAPAFPGERLALTTSQPITVTVTNSGQRPQTVRTVTGLAGPRLYAHDYLVSATDCPGRTLQSGQSCSVVVRNQPHGAGERPGALLIDTTALSRVVPLQANGTTPVVVANPGVVVSGRATELMGTGFPPDHPVIVVLPGNGPALVAQTNQLGAFTMGLPILTNGLIGTTSARVTAPNTDLAIPAPLLVVPGSYQPPTFLGRR